MSWKERIERSISITTGDGKIYSPLYKIGSRNIDYNVAQFEFPNIGGTLVKRSEYKGTKFSLELYFEGEDNVDVSREFEISARDKRPWRLDHPIYDIVDVHPTSLAIDNSGLNVSKVVVNLVETINEEAPRITQDPRSKTLQDVNLQLDTAANSFANDVSPSPSDLNAISANNNNLYTIGSSVVSDDHQFNEYFNLFNEANAAIINGTSDPLKMISSLQAVITYPYQFIDSVQTRVNMLVEQFLKLGESISNIVTPNEKKIYENNAGAVLMAMVNSSITSNSESDYGNKTDVLAVVDLLIQNYNLYIENLDQLQTDNGGEIDSYIPDFETMFQMNAVINFAISQLFVIALNAQQERIFVLDCPSNVIELAHRFYGLDPEDSTIDEFMRNNNIGLNEMFQLDVGREIIYYV